jgi:hypothetical protein
MYCVKCGSRIQDHERFCPQCGTKAPDLDAPVESTKLPDPESRSSAAAAMAGSFYSSGAVPVASAPAPKEAPQDHPAPPFKMFGVEMGEHAATEPPPIAPSSGDAGPVTRTSSGFGAAFWFGAFLLVVLGAVGFMAWTSFSSRSSGVSVRVDPSNVQIKAGATTPLTATVAGDPDAAVTWSVMEGAGAGFVRSTGVTAAGGKVAASAEYLAPLKPGTYHVLATSTKDQKQASSVEIVVSP